MGKLKRIFFAVFLLLLIVSAVSGSSADFSGPADVGERFLDVQTFLFRIAARNNWSLIVANDVTSSIKEVKGETVEEALKNYFSQTRFGWRLFENCLYVGDERDLERFLNDLPELEVTLPKGKYNTKFSGVFQRIELSFLCGMLRGISGVEIRTSDQLRVNVMMRTKNMSWQRIILAIVHLNRYRINSTDFSIIISPEGS